MANRDEKKQRSNQAKAARLSAQRRERTTKIVAIVAVIAILFTIAGIALNAGKDDKTKSNSASGKAGNSTTLPAPTTTAPAVATVCPPAEGAPRTVVFSGPPPTCIDASKTYTAEFDTTEGPITVALDAKRTPNVVNSFVVLSRYKYYDGTQIFRTDPSIDIIQGGSPHTQDNSDPGPGYTLTDEGGKFSYKEGDLVMARTGQPNSSGGQYFFATGPNVANLDSQGTYITFGKTTQGLDVLKKIIGLNADSGGQLGGKPSRTVTVNKVTIKES